MTAIIQVSGTHLCSLVEELIDRFPPTDHITAEDWKTASLAVYEVFCKYVDIPVKLAPLDDSEGPVNQIKIWAIESIRDEFRLGLHPHLAQITLRVEQTFDAVVESLQERKMERSAS